MTDNTKPSAEEIAEKVRYLLRFYEDGRWDAVVQGVGETTVTAKYQLLYCFPDIANSYLELLEQLKAMKIASLENAKSFELLATQCKGEAKDHALLCAKNNREAYSQITAV